MGVVMPLDTAHIALLGEPPRTSRVGRMLAGRFVRHMRREMDRNAWKGDHWRETHPHKLVEDLLYHALKLVRAVDGGGVVDRQAALEFAADVANLAAMLADNLGTVEECFEPAATPALGWGGADVKNMAAETCAKARTLVALNPDY